MSTVRPGFVLVVAWLALSDCVRRPCTSSAALGGALPLLDARFSADSCCGGPRYLWTGSACAEAPANTLCGCSCSGADCDKVFTSREACERAYSHCGAGRSGS